MAHRTRAQRKRQKGAPPAAVATQREPNGRLSRRKDARVARTAMSEAEAKAPMLAARAKMTGLPSELLDLSDAGRANAGTLHGIMRLRGVVLERHGHGCDWSLECLTAEQFEAAEWYIHARLDWLRAIGAANSSGSAPADGGDEQTYAKWVRSVRATWHDVIDVLHGLSIRLRSPVISALDTFLVRGADVEHMRRDLKAGLDAIAQRFLVARRDRAKAG